MTKLHFLVGCALGRVCPLCLVKLGSSNLLSIFTGSPAWPATHALKLRRQLLGIHKKEFVDESLHRVGAYKLLVAQHIAFKPKECRDNNFLENAQNLLELRMRVTFI